MADRSGTTSAGSDSARQVIATILAATFCRVILNVSRRFAYPFAPVLSRGLDVPLTAVTSLIAINQATGLAAMASGPLADSFGYRPMMMAAMAMLVAGMLAAGLFPLYGVVLACLLLAGTAKSIFDPAVQAYAGENVSYGQRGRVIGIMEFSWSASSLVGIPLVGVLIGRFGWRSPFFGLAAAALAAWAVLAITFRNNRATHTARKGAENPLRAWRQLLGHRPALGALGFAFFISLANDNLFVIYGAWLEEAFGLGVVALGVGTGLIGVAEFLGEVLTATRADRMGLKWAVGGGAALSILSYGLLPFCGRTLTTALAGLFVVFLTFEFSLVSFLSLATEMMPGLRATLMAAVLTAASLGRVVGALIGGPLWLSWGIQATALLSAATGSAALAILFWGMRGWQAQRPK